MNDNNSLDPTATETFKVAHSSDGGANWTSKVIDSTISVGNVADPETGNEIIGFSGGIDVALNSTIKLPKGQLYGVIQTYNTQAIFSLTGMVLFVVSTQAHS